MSRRTHSLNAYEVALTSSISDVDTSFPVESVAGLVAPGYLVIDPDDPLLREYFKFTSINGSNLEMTSTAFRGLTGSAAGAQAHQSGARVRAVAVGQWLEDIFSDIEDLEAEQAAFLLLDGTRAMQGALDMGGNKITALLDGSLDDEAVTRGYVGAADLLLLPRDGSRPMTNPLNMGGSSIENLLDSALDDGAITKKYVDDADTVLDDKFALYLPLAGGTVTGGVTFDGPVAMTSGLTIKGVHEVIEFPGQLRFATEDGVRTYILDSTAQTSGDLGLRIQGFDSEVLATFRSDDGVLNSGYVEVFRDLRVESVIETLGANLVIGRNAGGIRAYSDVTIVDQIGATSLTSLSLNGLDFLNAGSAFIRSANGVTAAPTYAFNADKSTGMYRPGVSQIAMAAGGVEVYFAGINFSYLPLPITNIRWQGIASMGSTGSAPNMYISPTTGQWFLSTSGARYKTNIDYDTDHLADLDLKPVTYHHDGDDADYIGFIADDIADLDERMGQFNEEGIIMNFETEAVVAILAAKTRRLELAVEALTNA